MVRRNGKKRARRRDTSIKLLNLAEGYFQGGIITKLAFNLTPVEFVLGDSGVGGITSANGTSITELVRDPSRFDQVAERFTAENIVMAGITSAVGNAAFRFGRKMLKRPISQVNSKIMKPLALGVKL